MGNTHPKAQGAKGRTNRKQVHWRAAERPSAPGKPQLVSDGSPTPDVVTIRWTLPVSDGGSPIIGYIVEHRRTGSPHWVRATPLPTTVTELSVGGLEPGWRYQFRVTATNAVGPSEPSEASDPVTVTLQRNVVAAPRFTEELKEATVLENEQLEMVVHIAGQPPPRVCWFKDGFEIFSSRRARITTDQGRSALTIHQVALSDEGEIKCTATNRAGHTSTAARVKIEAPPRVRPPRSYDEGLLFELDDVIRLKVGVAGRPPPLVFWTHNGESIQGDERIEVTEGEKSSELRVSRARRSDRGEYQVRAVNRLGEHSCSVLVTVADRPAPPRSAHVSGAHGRSVTLRWSEPEDDGGCRVSSYIVEYYRLGWDVWLKAASSRQTQATLADLIPGSEYKFRVKAENPYGVSEPGPETDVVFIPDPSRGLLTAPPRSRSQPRDVIQEAPVAPKRRSASSTRPTLDTSAIPSAMPARPKRDRLSTGQAPDPNMFDRASLTRELSYGIDLKLKPDIPKPPPKTPSPNRLEVNSDKSPSPNRRKSPSRINSLLTSILPGRRSSSPNPISFEQPIVTPPESPTTGVVVEEPTSVDEILKSPYYSDRRGSFHRSSVSPCPVDRSTSPATLQPASPTEDALNVRRGSTQSARGSPQHSPVAQTEMSHGSSEFMLVLFPGHGDKYNEDHGSYLGDSLIPPPMSLSAPELGADPDFIIPMKSSASSTELLHERAFSRFMQAEAEDEKLRTKDRRPSVPKILINSIDNEEGPNLERRPSFKRRLSAGITTMAQQYIWAKRRRSLRATADFPDPMKEEDHKESKPEMNAIDAEPNVEKKPKEDDFELLEVDTWEMERESSTESEDERLKYDVSPPVVVVKEEETYHPRLMVTTKKSDEPFEILTKPSPLPDPNFIPKPILKRPEDKKVENKIDKPNMVDITPTRELSEQLISAGEAARNKRLLNRQSSQEEYKAVAEHYADLVRDYGSGKRPPHRSMPNETEEVDDAKESVVTRRVTDRIVVTRPRRDPSPMVTSRRAASPAVRTRTASPAVHNRNLNAPVPNTTLPEPKKKTRSRSSSRTRASNSLVNNVVRPSSPKVAPRSPSPRSADLIAAAEQRVRSTLEYLTDLAMFVLACWLYLFKDARLAIPVLLVMVFRQLQDVLRSSMPKWARRS